MEPFVNITNKLKQVFPIAILALSISVSACDDRPKQQTGEVSVDTTAGQDIMLIDTTANVSYGQEGDAPTVAPDLDTLTYIDKGEKPDNLFEEKNKE